MALAGIELREKLTINNWINRICIAVECRLNSMGNEQAKIVKINILIFTIFIGWIFKLKKANTK